MNNENNNNKLSKIYNSILFFITFVSIVLFAKPIRDIITYTFNMILRGAETKNIQIEGLVGLSVFGAFIIPIMLVIILISLVVCILLIVMLFRTMKIKTRKVRGIEFLYLVLLSFVISISTGFYSQGSIISYIGTYSLFGVYIDIILLVIILIIRKKNKLNS